MTRPAPSDMAVTVVLTMGSAPATAQATQKEATVSSDPQVEPAEAEALPIVEPPGYTSSKCPPGVPVVVAFATPQRSVQTGFDIKAWAPPETGSISAVVVYENSVGWTHTETWIGGRPFFGSISLPRDNRGINNIVKVTATVHTGDSRNFECGVSFSWQGTLPRLEQKCFAHEDVFFRFDSPQRNVQTRVLWEHRPSLNGALVTMHPTNSIGQEGRFHTLVDTNGGPPQVIVLPGDGRGVYDVTSIRFNVTVDMSWWDLLECNPSVSTDGPVTELESLCFSGRLMEFTFASSRRAVQPRLTIETRKNPNMNLFVRFFDPQGREHGFDTIVESNQEGGLPKTQILAPDDGRGVFNVSRLTVQLGSAWQSVLACSLDVTDGGEMTPRERQCFGGQEMYFKLPSPLPRGRAIVAIEARRGGNYYIEGRLTSEAGVTTGYQATPGGHGGLPLTHVYLPTNGQFIDGLSQAFVKVSNGSWGSQLACEVTFESVLELHTES